MNRLLPTVSHVLGTLLIAAAPALAQDHKELGRMWTFENAPLDLFEKEYGFRPTQEWLDHVRLSALRFGQGCSASFISPRGLILTNHHCARGNVGSITPEGEDWLGDGYFADSLGQEVRVPDLTVQQLVAMRNVTEEMNAGIGPDSDEDARAEVLRDNRRDILAEVREAAPDFTHQLVSLYQGGMYQVYSYKIYDDIRLVASPNLQCAKFGGDPDNFTYPRFGLDYALLRAWENGKPADTAPHYFRFKTAGPTDGETVFVIGNPGSTGRLNTIAQMEYMRDEFYPLQLRGIGMMLGQIEQQTKDDPERAKQARTRRLSLENAQKAFRGFLDGLLNEDVMAIKRAAEKEIRERVDANPELKQKYGDAWTALETLSAKKKELGPAGARALQQDEQALAKRIGEAFFAVYGTDIPPDATFTLRISDGVVKGFPMNGTVAPWFTSLYGLYARHTEFGGKSPFNIPQIWLDRQDKLDLKTPFNLVSTCDIIGGNSGSPMINNEGEVVGLVFDGNIESLGNRFVYTDEIPRTVSVHPAIIIESLRKVYDRPKLADEVEGKAEGYK